MARTPHGASIAAARRGTGPPQVFETQGAIGRSRRVGSIHDSNAAELSARADGSALLRYAPRRAPIRALCIMNLGKGTGGIYAWISTPAQSYTRPD